MKSPVSFVAGSLFVATSLCVRAEFTAFNDVAPGPDTGANTTTFAPNATASGFLKDSETGDATAVTLTVSQSGLSFENLTFDHSAGTDAAEIFDGFVDFSAQNGNSLAVSGGDTFTYTFTGLDPASRYEFVGTACRGNAGYTDRWTHVTIEGADSFVAAHSTGQGIITAGFPAEEVAAWFGANHQADQGWVVQWTDIVPGADGTFSVVSRQHTGSTPFGNANGSKGYAINGIRLKESFIEGQPQVINVAATDITASGARIGGEVTDTGADTPTVRIYWGDEDGGSDTGAWDDSANLGSRTGAFGRVLSGLNPATTYYFRAHAQNSVTGVWATPTLSFETAALPPAVDNLPVAGLLARSAELGANVTQTGGTPPTVTVFYGTSDGGTNAGSWSDSVDLGVLTGQGSAVVTGLSPETTYRFRARATNTGGTVWAGSSGQFTTPAVTLPALTNGSPTGVTGISAVLRGEVTDVGADPPSVTLYYGTSDGGDTVGAWDAFVELGVQSGAFNRFVGNLLPETPYFFRARATNAAGSVWATPTGTFTTPEYVPPTVVINEIHYDENDKTVRAEFIELFNVSDDVVELDGWEISSGVDFVFGAGASIPAGGYLLVAEDPATVQSRFGRSGALGPWSGRLQNGGEVVTLRDPSGNVIDRVDYQLGFPWPTVGDPVGNPAASPSIQLVNPELENDVGGSWRSARPTPGVQNSVFAANVAPAIRGVGHEVVGRDLGRDDTVRPGEEVRIVATVTDADAVDSVSLDYQLVNPGDYIDIDDGRYNSSWTNLAMRDDGTGGDAFAGDGVFSTLIPAAVNTHRRLVRYRIRAADTAANSVRVPYPDDPVPNFAYFVYGAIPTWTASDRPGQPMTTYDFTQMEPVAVYQLITTRDDHEDAQSIPNASGSSYRGSDYLWKGTLVYEGKVYDHIRFRARGGVWRYSMGKNMWKFDFNRGHRFQARDDYDKKYRAAWSKLNFSALIQQGNFRQRGEQGLFEGAGFKNHNLSDNPAPKTHYVHFRIIEHADENGPTASQYDTDFQGLYMAIEQLDGQFLDEHDLPDGYLWKIEGNNNQNPPNNQAPYLESSLPNGDVDDFIAGYRNGSPSADWWKSKLDLDEYYSFRANATWVHDYDIHAGKNYFFLHNPETDQWRVVNWDLDLTWTTTYGGGGTRGPLSDDVLGIPEFALGYRNRVRDLADLLHNSEQQGMLLDEIAHWVYTPGQPSMVDADRAMWDYNPILTSGYINSSKAGHGRYYEDATTPSRTFAGMVAKLKSYAAGRVNFMRSSYLSDENSVPRKPTVTYQGAAGFPTDDLRFTSSAFSSPSGGTFAAQRWRIAEVTLPDDPRFDPADPLFDRYAERKYEIEATWESGDVTTTDFAATVPAEDIRPGRLYRVRTKMLDTAGRWGRWSDPVEFTASAPDVSRYQEDLWITEFMYHPAAPSGGELAVSTDQDDFEFIELKNVGDTALDLRDVRFTKGVDFDFGGSAIETLAPGAFVLVVSDVAAFEERYGVGLPVAGEFDGSRLDNGGERLKLSFGAGVTIHDIDPYDDSAPWPAAADGSGASLVLIDGGGGETPDHADPASWRASSVLGGTPGSDEAPPADVYGEWKVANGVIDDAGDGDGDGVVALLEFFLSGDPGAVSVDLLPEMTAAGELVFVRRADLGTVTYVVEVSDDLVTWTTLAGGVSVPAGDGLVADTWPVGTGGTRYVRVRVSSP